MMSMIAGSSRSERGKVGSSPGLVSGKSDIAGATAGGRYIAFVCGPP